MSFTWMNPEIEVRIEALLSKMTIAQKVGQVTQPERMSCSPSDAKKYHIGSILSGGGSAPQGNRPADWVRMNDQYWLASTEQDEEHLSIPIIYGVDAIHGNNNVLGATIFPHNIGLGAARDPYLLKKIAQATAREVLATGLEWTFAPTLAVARNHHWGRTYESYSEDPGVVSSYAGEFVDGLQSSTVEDRVVACVKHWVGDGGTTSGIDQGDTKIDADTLRSVHLSPYLPAIEAGSMTVMASFNSWNGDKCHGHKYLLTEVLKQELGFQGFIISDWDGIDYLSDDYYEAVGLAMGAGIDMFMVSENWREFIDALISHVDNGTVSQQRLDDAVRRILRVKFLAGLFDHPKPSERKWSNSATFGAAEHRELAREAVRKSLVLLKNEQEILPLSKSSKILVAGKSAHNRGHQCGGFTVAWQGVNDNESIEGGCSVWEGIQKHNPNAELSRDGFGLEADPADHDVAIVVIGERPYAEGLGDVRNSNQPIIEAGSQIKGLMKVLEPYGSSLNLCDLHPEDLATIRNITQRGVPVVAVMLSGRPLVVNQELELVSAFVAAWLPGSEGQGISDVLFGDYDFSGKLPFTWPRAVRPGESSENYDVLFPYGFGMQYRENAIAIPHGASDFDDAQKQLHV